MVPVNGDQLTPEGAMFLTGGTTTRMLCTVGVTPTACDAVADALGLDRADTHTITLATLSG